MSPSPVSPARALVSRLFLAVVGFFALIFAAAAVSGRLLPGIPRGDATHVVTVAVFLAGTLAVWALSAQARDYLVLQWRLAASGWRWLLLAAVAGVVFRALAFVFEGTDPDLIQGWRVDLRFVLSYLLLSSLLQPLVEETFFRGLAIGRSRGVAAWVSAALAGLAFAAIHPDRWLSVFVFSLVAAGFYLRSGLLAAYAFHAAYNLANFAALAYFSAR